MEELEYSDIEELEEDEEQRFTWGDLEQNVYLLNETLAQLATVSADTVTKINQQQQLIERIHNEVVAQGNIVTENFKQSAKLNETLTKTQPDNNHFGEKIEHLQDAIRGFLKTQNQNNRSPILQPTLPFSFRPRSAVILLAIQSFLLVTAITVVLNLYPPPASTKNEQQLYSIFQRVDKLYRARFGNK